MTFRITHVGATGARHRFRLRARSNEKAIAWALQLFGDARSLSCINLGRGAK